MEVASNHHRDSSLSSFGSVHSVDIDAFFDDLGTPHVPPSSNNCSLTVPCRTRLGAGMAIIAATSPEIKALNLPITPTFPMVTSNHHRRNSSNDTFSSTCSSLSSSSLRRKVKLSPLLASMDDVEGSPALPNRRDQQAMHIFLDETDDLVRSFQNHGMGTKWVEAKYDGNKNFQFDDKENIHPNLLHEKHLHQGQKKLPGPLRNHNRRPKRLPKKPSLHRRASCDMLPSPAEIGCAGCVSPRVVRRATSGSFPFFPADMEMSRELQRQRSERSLRMGPKSMRLSTGFR